MELNQRFRGYLPVVVDFETGGFDAVNNPLLEVACVMLDWEEDQLVIDQRHAWSVDPFNGSNIDPASLKVTGIDVDDPMRGAQDEKLVLGDFFKLIRIAMKRHRCQRAILVAHNASFDQGFLNAACTRAELKRNPFHPFTTLDTATLAALAYGHTVLSEACRRANLEFDASKAHNAAYDADRTAELFCNIVNTWGDATGLPG